MYGRLTLPPPPFGVDFGLRRGSSLYGVPLTVPWPPLYVGEEGLPVLPASLFFPVDAGNVRVTFVCFELESRILYPSWNSRGRPLRCVPQVVKFLSPLQLGKACSPGVTANVTCWFFQGVLGLFFFFFFFFFGSMSFFSRLHCLFDWEMRFFRRLLVLGGFKSLSVSELVRSCVPHLPSPLEWTCQAVPVSECREP